MRLTCHFIFFFLVFCSFRSTHSILTVIKSERMKLFGVSFVVGVVGEGRGGVGGMCDEINRTLFRLRFFLGDFSSMVPFVRHHHLAEVCVTKAES